MANISADDVRRLDQLKLRWKQVRTKKLKSQLNDVAWEYANTFVAAYKELFGTELIIVDADFVNKGNYDGYELRFRSREEIKEQQMILFQTTVIEEINHIIDYKIISNREVLVFVRIR